MEACESLCTAKIMSEETTHRVTMILSIWLLPSPSFELLQANDVRRRTLSVKLHLRNERTGGQKDTHASAHQQRPPRSPPSRRVDVAATRRPCQKKTDGQTNERTDRRQE